APLFLGGSLDVCTSLPEGYLHYLIRRTSLEVPAAARAKVPMRASRGSSPAVFGSPLLLVSSPVSVDVPVFSRVVVLDFSVLDFVVVDFDGVVVCDGSVVELGSVVFMRLSVFCSSPVTPFF